MGLLERIASLGLTLHSLTPLETENAGPARNAPTTSSGVYDRHPGTIRRDRELMTVLWIMLAIVYAVC